MHGSSSSGKERDCRRLGQQQNEAADQEIMEGSKGGGVKEGMSMDRLGMKER
jgi:hypothetical protein